VGIHAKGDGMTTCPACNSGSLIHKIEQRPAEWEGRSGTVNLCYSECIECGSEIVDEAQSKFNKQAILDFRSGE
jgi:transposase-like protein